MNNLNLSKNEPLPFEVIIAAVNGDIEAINRVINYYSGYIRCLSKIDLYDEFGNRYEYNDEEKRQLLEIQLITKVISFKANQVV